MTALDRNRLDEEESPYLRAHADNPVNWQPWDEAALEAARERDVPIFLSVGYAACHWCHVMADESFDDEAVAAVLNEEFVPIKVDREERPDVDSIYQTVCQQVTGRGGWPLSVWLTPDQRPFQVGTYFPREPRRGMPGFLELLEDISEAWNDPEQRERMEGRAEQWTQAVTGQLEDVPEEAQSPDEEILTEAAKAAVRGADREHGGWGSGPKFPHTGRLHILARAYNRTERDVYLDVFEETLDAMANGGMYDHIGGGFHRYATDRDWTVPHFEKMLYDNAVLPGVYLTGYRLTGNERYANVARATLGFVERELTHEEGGFFSTLDAQSEDESGERAEGAYYVWTPDQVQDAIDEYREPSLFPEAGLTDNEKMATLFCQRFGVTERGNFEGKTVLTLERSLDDLAEEHDMQVQMVQKALERAHELVLQARADRPRPPRDEKILAGWNGLMCSAFAEASLVLEDVDPDPAIEALSFVREHLWDENEKRLTRRYKDGVTKIDGYLEDYAYLGRAALDVFQATRDVEWLAFAMTLGEAIARDFWDEKRETLYFTPRDGEKLIARPQELHDQSTPSSAGVAAELLDVLGHFRPDDEFADIATAVVDRHGSRITANPLQHASLTLAADAITEGIFEVVLVADEVPDEWYEELASRYLGASILAWRPADQDRLQEWTETLGFEETPPIWHERVQRNDEPTVYTCRSFTCSPGRNEIERALNWGEGML